MYELTTESGKKIQATDEHKFLVEIGLKGEEHFLPLSKLQVGDSVITKCENHLKVKERHYRKSITGKFFAYPNARIK